MLNKFGPLMTVGTYVKMNRKSFRTCGNWPEANASQQRSKLKRIDDVVDKENISPRTNVSASNDGKHTARTVAQRSPTHRVPHQGTDILTVDESRDNPDETLTLTVGSGAAENVIGQHMCPGTAMRASAGSRCGVQYTTAEMPDRGEKEVKVVTGEGQKYVVMIQVTAVTKALVSVSSICDAGHRVVFERAGGYSQGVYRTKVKLADGKPVFMRPGR